jgi:hypothetical protein
MAIGEGFDLVFPICRVRDGSEEINSSEPFPSPMPSTGPESSSSPPTDVACVEMECSEAMDTASEARRLKDPCPPSEESGDRSSGVSSMLWGADGVRAATAAR